MLNDVKFNNDKSAFIDWNIVLTSVDIPLPEPKRTLVEVQGADGLIDLTTVLTGDVTYNNRDITLNFEMMDTSNYYDLMSEISNYLHGKVVTFTLSKDKNFYYKGTASINSWECNRQQGLIVIHIDADPYKYEILETIINITLSGKQAYFNLPNLRKRVCPTLTATGDVYIYGDEILPHKLKQGEQQILSLMLNEGDNIWLFEGDGKVKITYRRCSL